jgi:hypothetical protein
MPHILDLYSFLGYFGPLFASWALVLVLYQLYVRYVIWLHHQIETGSFLKPMVDNFCLVAWDPIVQAG